ncbi:MAG: hypothetical protein VW397_05200 [Candidatus Margulisiibacteriota bacterium]
MKDNAGVQYYRINGQFDNALEKFLSLPKDERCHVMIDIAFIYYSKQDYHLSLTYFLTYLSKTKITSVNNLVCFLATKLLLHFPNHPILNDILPALPNHTYHLAPVGPFKIKSFNLCHYPRLNYIFSGHCPHCTHTFEINTSMSFIVNFRSPCPKCFQTYEFKSEDIKMFIDQLNNTFLFNQSPVKPETDTFNYNFLDSMLNKHFSTCLSTVFLRSKNK